jgi:uncharacterized repeat protein (TIGR01451 family)
MSISTQWWVSGCILLAIQSVSLSVQAACTNGTDVGGTVFQELPFDGATGNTYGDKDTNENGIENVTVNLLDASGATHSTITDANGAWDSSGTSLTYPVRVEFSWAQSWLESSPDGNDSATSVQFAPASDCNLDFGLYVPADYHSGGLPDYVIPSYVNGDGTGDGASDASLYEAPYTATGLNGSGGTTPTQVADVSELGAVWGEAYHKDNKRLYISALMKRHVGFANSPGSIYVVDYSTATPNYLGTFDLQGVTPGNGGAAIDFGSVCRASTCAASGTGIASDYELPSSKGSPNIDLDAFSKVGKVAYGDIDMQPGSNYLWAVNLFQQALIRIDVSGNPVSTAPADIEQYILSGLPGYPSAGSGEMRPWGLGFNEDKGYLGVVNDTTITAYVLEFDPNNIAAGFTTAISFDPNAQRSVFLGDFYPWKDVWTSANHVNPNPDQDITLTIGGNIAHFAQPILSDIDFDENGDMFMSLADRFGHQMGAQNYWAVSGATDLVSAEAKGDTKKACKTTSGYEFEGSASCPVGAGSEFIQDLSGNGTTENAEGASALLKGTQQILSVSIDPNPAVIDTQYMDSQGVMTYGLDNGEYDNWYTFYRNATVELFDKANGLGDIEFLTEPAPLEIGNRVWEDLDADGEQDPGEPGINGAQVTLTCGAESAQKTTAGDGNYLFTDADFTNGIPRGSNCSLTLSDTQTGGSGQITFIPNPGGVTDTVDSDGSASGGTVTHGFTTGLTGQNNHTYDFGYRDAPAGGSITIIKDATPDDPQDFAFTATGSGVSSFSLDDDADGTLSNTQSFTGLADGAYNFTETTVADWVLTGISCSGASNSTITINATGVDINLSNGENITCTFYNNNHTCPSGQILNQVVVTANEDESTYANNSDEACLEITGSPTIDLALTKTASTSSVNSGDTVTYTLTITNNGSGYATGIEVMDQLPIGVTYSSDTPSQGSYNNTTGIWTVGALANGSTATLAIMVSVD